MRNDERFGVSPWGAGEGYGCGGVRMEETESPHGVPAEVPLAGALREAPHLGARKVLVVP